MKKLFLFVLLFTCMSFWSGETVAREKGKHKFEIGAGADIYGILGMVGGPSQNPGPRGFLEYRYFITDGWDVGVNLAYQFNTSESNTPPPEQRYSYSSHMPNISALTEYVFLPGRKVRPFIGAGIGYGMIATVHDSSRSGLDETRSYGLVYPRIGIEFLGHFRLSVELKYAWEPQYGFMAESTKGVSLSWVF